VTPVRGADVQRSTRAIRVLKFGGTCLARPTDRNAATERVREALAEGVVPVVVVSAPGRMGAPYATDTLAELARSHNPDIQARELALLLSTGEIVSAVLMTAALRACGVEAAAITGRAAGIRTRNGYVGAAVRSVEPTRLLQWLGRGIVPVVTGFQGRGPDGDVAVLERGGSDITAAALARALGAEQVDIFGDVPGMMTADPRIVHEARLIERLGFREALLLARHGAKVVHPVALRWASRAGVPVHVRSLYGESAAGTVIASEPATELEGDALGVACHVPAYEQAALVALVHAGMCSYPRPEEVMRSILSTERVHVLSTTRTPGVAIAAVPLADLERTARALHARFLEPGDRPSHNGLGGRQRNGYRGKNR